MTPIQSAQQLDRAMRAARKQLKLTQPQLALAAGTVTTGSSVATREVRHVS